VDEISSEHDGRDTARNVIVRRVVLLVVVAAFTGLVIWKTLPSGSAEYTGPGPAGSVTSVRNDAVADYESALAGGKPIFVLFHSLTCEPCIEISQVADVVVPQYEDRVAFVNVITGDPSGQQLARRFSFQYIPTSFFLAPDGAVVESFTGSMDEAEMRSRLDALLESR